MTIPKRSRCCYETVVDQNSRGRNIATAPTSTMIPTIGQRAACAAVHPVVFASLIDVSAPGIVAARTYAPMHKPMIPPIDSPIAIFHNHILHIIICICHIYLFPTVRHITNEIGIIRTKTNEIENGKLYKDIRDTISWLTLSQKEKK